MYEYNHFKFHVMKYFKLALAFAIIITLDSCFLKKEILSDCKLNNTGEVYFVNNSATGKSYDIIWDGTKVATVGPFSQSSTITVTASISHTLLFRVAGTSTTACSQSTPSVPQCQKWNFSCSY